MLMKRAQVEEESPPATYASSEIHWRQICPRNSSAAELVPLQVPFFADCQQFINWWMARHPVIFYPVNLPNVQVNLSPPPEAETESQLTAELSDVVSLIAEREIGDQIDGTTDHAWLVVLGHFAQALDLVACLSEVSLSQRQGANGKPQSKIIEFLVGILGGIDYLRDLNESANPIATDATVVEA